MKLKVKLMIIAMAVAMTCPAYAEEQIQLETVLVTASKVAPYSDLESPVTAGSRIPTKPIDSPRSVQTIDAQAFLNQGSTDVAQAIMRNAPGIGLNANLAGNRSNVMLRGFNIHDNFGSKIDGQQNLTWADVDLYNIEQIQVFKGPNAAYAGMSDPGGYINYITKKADWTNRFETFQSATSSGGYLGSIQQNYAIHDAFAGRTVLTYGDGPNPALDGNTRKQRVSLSQNFEWKIGPNTLAEFDYRHAEDNQNYGNTSLLPAVGTAPAPIRLSTNMASPYDHFNVKEDSLSARLKHKFNDDLSWVAMVKWQRDDRLQQYLSPKSLSNAGILQTSYNNSDSVKTYSSYDTYLTLNKSVFGMKNSLIAGIDFAESVTDGWNKSASTSTYNINIYRPSFVGFNWKDSAQATSWAKQTTYGAYAQDQLYLTDSLILSGGVRYNSSAQQATSTSAAGVTTQTTTDASDYRTSPNVGVVYKFTPNISVYADYAEGFMPQSQSNAGVTVSSSAYAPPLIAKQKEVGFKYIDPGKGYSFTAAWFDLTLENFSTPDPSNTLLTVYTGEVRNKGIELQGTAKLTKNLTFIVNYAYTASEVTKDNPAANGTSNVGNQLASIAPNMANGWLMWDDQWGTHAWGAGTGLTYMDKRPGDIQNDFWLPSYMTWNGSAYFDPYKNTRVQLTLNNIANEKYYAAANSRFAILQGTPFVAILTINFKYE